MWAAPWGAEGTAHPSSLWVSSQLHRLVSEEFANRWTPVIHATLSATSAEACGAKLIIYRAFCWKNSVQPTKAPTKMTDTNPILVRIGCQYNHLFLFRSVSFSLFFICCTFWAVLAFLSSRRRLRRALWTNKSTSAGLGSTMQGEHTPPAHPTPLLNSFRCWNKKGKSFSTLNGPEMHSGNSITIAGTVLCK